MACSDSQQQIEEGSVRGRSTPLSCSAWHRVPWIVPKALQQEMFQRYTKKMSAQIMFQYRLPGPAGYELYFASIRSYNSAIWI